MTRKRDESILVGRNIEVVVVDIRGDKVRLGINAPVELPVHRREVFDSIYGTSDRSGSRLEIVRPDGASDSVAASAIGLPAAQLAFLDRLRETIGAQSGEKPRREQTLSAILSAIREVQDALGAPATLEQFKTAIIAAVKGSAARE